MTKRIALLGSTGSIGTQALDVISKYPEMFRVDLLTAWNNVDLLTKQALEYRPDSVVIGNEKHYQQLKKNLEGTAVKVFTGVAAMEERVAASNAEMVIASIVGYSGLRPVVAAIRSGKNIALANKETLVVAGSVITRLIREYGVKMIPVDSEHSAIFQCLAGESSESVEKITLTASGGPFLRTPAEKLHTVKPSDALKHPNWSMGDKVTIDSASMMNKGLEVIEAKWLFNLHPDQIKVIIHPQSIIHSFVHFRDGSVKAQLGIPDMRLPILYALSYPERLQSDLPRLNFGGCDTYNFIEPDLKKFRNLSLAFGAIREGGSKPCVLNAANEVAVNAFLKGRIGFMQMPDVVENALVKSSFLADPSLEELGNEDKEARMLAENFINNMKIKI